MTEFYRSYRIIDGKPKWVIVDEDGKIINRDPSKDELKGLKKEPYKVNRKMSYTDDELLEFMRLFYKENGRPPTSRDFDNNPEYPGSLTYVRHFGSWNNALKMAGFTPIDNRGYQYTTKELLEFLREFERENGRSPKEEDFNNNPEYPGPKTYQRRFGSWNNSLKMARLQINVFTNCTDEELLEFLRQYQREKGRTPDVLDFNNDIRYPSYSVYIRHFGSWNNALKMAMLQINVFTKCTDEELLEYLIKFYEEKGRPPTVEDFIGNHEYPSFRIYQYKFGGWQKALRLVGLDVGSMVRKGIIETEQQKARQAEMHVLENDEKGATDLSGENSGSFADGISRISKGQIFDVKSSKLHKEKYWSFHLDKCVDFYYLLAYDKEHKNLLYKWKVPGDFVDGIVVIGNNNHYTYNIENMKEFEISL